MTDDFLQRESSLSIFSQLNQRYGEQHWWPAETDFEMMIGAVLVQHTAWRNVETSIERLKSEKLLLPQRVASLHHEDLMEIIRPSGFMKAKARTCINLSTWLVEHGIDSADVVPSRDPHLRNDLVSIPGIGPETADVIRLYAFQQKSFIWDVYARRLLPLFNYPQWRTYEEARQHERTFIDIEGFSLKALQEYHALIVAVGKESRIKGENPLFLNKQQQE